MMSKEKYNLLLKSNLSINQPVGLTALDLFSGCGGMSLGFESIGICTTGFDSNVAAVKTYNRNLNGKAVQKKLSLDIDYDNFDLILAGPPCQPYSSAGKKLGVSDSRNGFPVVLDAIAKLSPKVFLIENVKGLLKNKSYLEEIIKTTEGLGYTVSMDVINAKGFGVPQNRERLFAVGVRGGKKFQFPKAKYDVLSVGESIGRVRSSVPKGTKILTPNIDRYILKYEIASKCKRPRDLHLDIPSRTITCRNLSGSTGDMMRLRLNDGRRRTLSVREAATLQSFPSWFKFCGSDSEKFKQIGNAVPPMLAKAIAIEIKQQYFS